MSYAILLSPIEDKTRLVTWTCLPLKMAAIDDLLGHVFRALVHCGMGCLFMQGFNERVCDVVVVLFVVRAMIGICRVCLRMRGVHDATVL
jgi:hypothetical protein